MGNSDWAPETRGLLWFVAGIYAVSLTIAGVIGWLLRRIH